mgnify:CR=1 FL=1
MGQIHRIFQSEGISQKAEKISDNAYETYIDNICRGQRDKSPFENKKDLSLLVEFITEVQKSAAEKIQRNHGEAIMVSEVKTGSYKAGDRDIFITLLTPHKREEDAKSLTGKLKIDSVFKDKDALSLTYDGKTNLVYKLNLNHGIHPYEEDRAPAYDWETGKIEYGKITTDADFAFVIDGGTSCRFGMFNSCGIYYNNNVLYETPRYTTRDFMVEKFKEIDHKWRCWSGSAEIK